MKPLPVLFAAALLSAGVSACGSGKNTSSASPSPNAAATGSTVAGSASSATPTGDYTKADTDKDNDIGAPSDDTNNNYILDYAHAASTADKRAVTALIKRYYAAAAVGDGAKACSMMYVTFAEAVAEDYGQGSAGDSYLRQGKTCPAVMALLFKHYHGQLAAELPILEVTRVRLDRHHGLAVLSFGTMPERQIPVRRERRAWKIGAVLDSELP
jgi:hypothetical protein